MQANPTDVFNSDKPPGITAEKVFEWAVLALTAVITVWTAWWLHKKMLQVRPVIIAERE